MRLLEAKNNIDQIDAGIKGLRLKLKNGSLNSVPSVFNSFNELLNEKEKLAKKIRKAELNTVLGGVSLLEVEVTINVLDLRIAVLSELVFRGDMSEEQLFVIYKNLHLFRETRDSLDTQYQRCLWETELLDE